VAKHCCCDMDRRVNHRCKVHRYPFDCPDHVIYYDGNQRTYGLLFHDGGSSFYETRLRPWCGKRLPHLGEADHS
jgi:hypothetical protein